MSNIDDPFKAPGGRAPLVPEVARLPPSDLVRIGAPSDPVTFDVIEGRPSTGETPPDAPNEPAETPSKAPPDIEAEVRLAFALARSRTAALDAQVTSALGEASGDLSPPVSSAPSVGALQPPSMVVEGVASAWSVEDGEGGIRRLVHRHSVTIEVGRTEKDEVVIVGLEEKLEAACRALALVRLGIALTSIPAPEADDGPPTGRAVLFRLVDGQPTPEVPTPDVVVDLTEHAAELGHVAKELSSGVLIVAPGPAAVRTQVLGPSPVVEIPDLPAAAAWAAAAGGQSDASTTTFTVTLTETVLIQRSRLAQRLEFVPKDASPPPAAPGQASPAVGSS